VDGEIATDGERSRCMSDGLLGHVVDGTATVS